MSPVDHVSASTKRGRAGLAARAASAAVLARTVPVSLQPVAAAGRAGRLP